jgi:hypothetical protein
VAFFPRCPAARTRVKFSRGKISQCSRALVLLGMSTAVAKAGDAQLGPGQAAALLRRLLEPYPWVGAWLPAEVSGTLPVLFVRKAPLPLQPIRKTAAAPFADPLRPPPHSGPGAAGLNREAFQPRTSPLAPFTPGILGRRNKTKHSQSHLLRPGAPPHPFRSRVPAGLPGRFSQAGLRGHYTGLSTRVLGRHGARGHAKHARLPGLVCSWVPWASSLCRCWVLCPCLASIRPGPVLRGHVLQDRASRTLPG